MSNVIPLCCFFLLRIPMRMPLQLLLEHPSLLIIEAIFCAYNEHVTEHIVRKGWVSLLLLRFLPVLLTVGDLFSLVQKKKLELESRKELGCFRESRWMAVGSETGRRNGTPHANENDDVIDEKRAYVLPDMETSSDASISSCRCRYGTAAALFETYK